MSYKTTEYERLSDEGLRLHDELNAILSEHLPPDVLQAVHMKVSDLQSNCFAMADYDTKRLYRAVMGFIPEHYSEVRAAFMGICFDGSRCDEKDWTAWESGVQWPITPDYIDLLESRSRKGGETC